MLKIARHCRENDATAMVTGQLLGLDVGATLEVTDCFPYPVRRRSRDCAACAVVGLSTASRQVCLVPSLLPMAPCAR